MYQYLSFLITWKNDLGVYIYIFRTKYYKKDNNKYANLTFDLNGGCRIIHVLLSQFLIHVHNFFLVSKHAFSGPRIMKKDNNKYANLIFDHRGSHFFPKWPPEYTCFIISVSNWFRKKILVSKYTFSGPRITQNAIKNTLIYYFHLNGGHFSKWPPEYTCFNIPATNQHGV